MFSNKLVNETSVYLLQHAHNQVNWYPWGEEAFSIAINENKPIILSIGYAACHWCHVMEKESFEDIDTANLMNKHFVCIKIDREERPDIDSIYMDAVQAITGSGGWPLNVFLTPQKKPFYGGTYFPPERRYNKLSWKEILQNIITAFNHNKDEVEAQAEKLLMHLKTANNFQNIQKNNKVNNSYCIDIDSEIATAILKSADLVDGGFGNAPKFLQTYSIQYLLRHYHFTKSLSALQHAEITLNKMIAGGIYDQIGGGFSRYSTDNKWLVPHFEKMLYDNALMVNVLSEAYLITHSQLYCNVINQTLDFISNEMTAPTGGFYTAFDADSDGEEGKFYTWTKTEIEHILGKHSSLFCNYYNITEKGNWEGCNILHTKNNIQQIIANYHISEENLTEIILQCNTKLLSWRNRNRNKPILDDKIILGWNALMITAYCKAYTATLNNHYKQIAIKQLHFLENNLKVNHRWKHTYKNNHAKIDAFLDDYAYLIEAYINLQEITADSKYLKSAKELLEFVIENFNSSTNLFYYTQNSQTDVIIQKTEVYDGALPSANAIMAYNLQYLGIIFNNTKWRIMASEMIDTLYKSTILYPNSFAVWASLIQQKIYGVNEIAMCGSNVFDYLPQFLKKYIPNKVFQSSDVEKKDFPLLNNRFVKEKNTFYLCRNNSCNKPLTDIDEFLAIV